MPRRASATSDGMGVVDSAVRSMRCEVVLRMIVKQLIATAAATYASVAGTRVDTPGAMKRAATSERVAPNAEAPKTSTMPNRCWRL